jgi:hypothetical protein
MDQGVAERAMTHDNGASNVTHGELTVGAAVSMRVRQQSALRQRAA